MLLGYFGGDDNDVAFLGGMGQGFRDDSSLSLKNRDDVPNIVENYVTSSFDDTFD